jgi:hypothetical protein
MVWMFRHHTMISILKRDNACPALPACPYEMYRHQGPEAWSRFCGFFSSRIRTPPPRNRPTRSRSHRHASILGPATSSRRDRNRTPGALGNSRPKRECSRRATTRNSPAPGRTPARRRARHRDRRRARSPRLPDTPSTRQHRGRRWPTRKPRQPRKARTTVAWGDSFCSCLEKPRAAPGSVP